MLPLNTWMTMHLQVLKLDMKKKLLLSLLEECNFFSNVTSATTDTCSNKLCSNFIFFLIQIPEVNYLSDNEQREWKVIAWKLP